MSHGNKAPSEKLNVLKKKKTMFTLSKSSFAEAKVLAKQRVSKPKGIWNCFPENI